jgi:hypothetical protein
MVNWAMGQSPAGQSSWNHAFLDTAAFTGTNLSSERASP